MSITIDNEVLSYLEEWAKKEQERNGIKISRTQWMHALLKIAVQKNKAGEITNPYTLKKEDFEQIQKFILLLVGEIERNGISFANLEDVLEIPQEKLDDLYKMVFTMREVKRVTEKTELPSGYKWKLVKE